MKTELIPCDFTKHAVMDIISNRQACIDEMTAELTQYRAALERCVGALEGLLVHAVEFRNDWVKGDFELCELAQRDMRRHDN